MPDYALSALGPLDGRYAKDVEPLRNIFCEAELIRRRLGIEVEWLIALSEESGALGAGPAFSDGDKERLRSLYETFTLEDAAVVKAIEEEGYHGIKATRHDVKAIEYFMRERLAGAGLDECMPWMHFGLTSEDVNDPAYATMVSDAVGDVLLPELEGLHKDLVAMARGYAAIPMLARTHGQPASPTTLGKEYNVFATRLARQIDEIGSLEIGAKFSGATGNHNALSAAFPQLPATYWTEFTQQFLKKIAGERRVRIRPELVTTQVSSHDTYAELFHALTRANNVIIGMDRDTWTYISDGWLAQKPTEGEVGSSTMPHKVNPISFENSEGNLELANAMLYFLASDLPISRLQRDLSGSTVKRNVGVALGHCLVGYASSRKGLARVSPHKENIAEALRENPQVVAEGVQTLLRAAGVPEAYEMLMERTRGKEISLDDLRGLADGLELPDSVRTQLRNLAPENYTGIAKHLAML